MLDRVAHARSSRPVRCCMHSILNAKGAGMVADLDNGPELLVRPTGLGIIQASAALAQVVVMPRLHGMDTATS